MLSCILPGRSRRWVLFFLLGLYPNGQRITSSNCKHVSWHCLHGDFFQIISIFPTGHASWIHEAARWQGWSQAHFDRVAWRPSTLSGIAAETLSFHLLSEGQTHVFIKHGCGFRGKYLVFDGFCQWHGELEQYLVKCFNFTSPSHGSTDFFGSCLTELFETTGLDILSMEMPTIEAVTQFHRHCTALDALNLDSVSVSPTELVLCHSTFSNVRKPWVSYILIYTYDIWYVCVMMCYCGFDGVSLCLVEENKIRHVNLCATRMWFDFLHGRCFGQGAWIWQLTWCMMRFWHVIESLDHVAPSKVAFWLNIRNLSVIIALLQLCTQSLPCKLPNTFEEWVSCLSHTSLFVHGQALGPADIDHHVLGVGCLSLLPPPPRRSLLLTMETRTATTVKRFLPWPVFGLWLPIEFGSPKLYIFKAETVLEQLRSSAEDFLDSCKSVRQGERLEVPPTLRSTAAIWQPLLKSRGSFSVAVEPRAVNWTFKAEVQSFSPTKKMKINVWDIQVLVILILCLLTLESWIHFIMMMLKKYEHLY